MIRILLIVAISLSCFGQGAVVPNRRLNFKTVAAASCNTLKDSLTTHGTGGPSISLVPYQAIAIIAGSSYTWCSSEISIVKSGTPSFPFDLSVWSDSGTNAPLAVICAASATTNASSLATGTTTNKFIFSTSSSVVIGTRYWLVTHATSIPFDNTIQFEAAGFSGGQQASSGDGVTWSTNSYGTVTAWANTYAP